MAESTFKYKVEKPGCQARFSLGEPQSCQLGVGLYIRTRTYGY
jgi:hypothetical protein